MKSPLFSILIPSWNNLEYLKLCIKSIRKNSKFEHEIIVFLNEGNDGSLEWVEGQKVKFLRDHDNVGICHALNRAGEIAICDYIVYLNDDMYVCPDWDFYLYEEIKGIPDEKFFISGTMIEPRDTGNPSVLAPFNFGDSVENFEEKRLLESADILRKNDWQGSMWPPSLVHKKMWEKVEGLSVEFSPGMYSDPDFAMKLWVEGVRYFKGVGKSKVYHFQSKSTGHVVRNDGRKQFLQKWGVSSSYFTKNILELGQEFKGALPDKIIKASLKDKIKRRLSS